MTLEITYVTRQYTNTLVLSGEVYFGIDAEDYFIYNPFIYNSKGAVLGSQADYTLIEAGRGYQSIRFVKHTASGSTYYCLIINDAGEYEIAEERKIEHPPQTIIIQPLR